MNQIKDLISDPIKLDQFLTDLESKPKKKGRFQIPVEINDQIIDFQKQFGHSNSRNANGKPVQTRFGITEDLDQKIVDFQKRYSDKMKRQPNKQEVIWYATDKGLKEVLPVVKAKKFDEKIISKSNAIYILLEFGMKYLDSWESDIIHKV